MPSSVWKTGSRSYKPVATDSSLGHQVVVAVSYVQGQEGLGWSCKSEQVRKESLSIRYGSVQNAVQQIHTKETCTPLESRGLKQSGFRSLEPRSKVRVVRDQVEDGKDVILRDVLVYLEKYRKRTGFYH